MKKYFTRLLTLAVIAPALVSCAEQLPDFGPQAKKHTVYFSTAEEATRTGLSIDEDEGIVTPDWRGTTKNDVYVFEMDGTQTGIMGETTELFYEEDALEAHFKVDFYTNMTIHVETPPSPTLPADGTRASGSGTRASGSGYTYGAVVANKNESEEEPIFYIPATQKPDPNTLKDPGAEFLIGFSRDAYDAEPDGDANFVDLYFDRVAALSRIGFSEFQGTNEKVMSIKINSETSMTGWASFNDIRFGNTNTVTFHQDEGPGLLALNYGDGLSVTAGETFYAYFVSMPGTFKITSIEILTDQYIYTKEINRDVEFTITELKNLKLTGATAEKISSNVWYKASMLEAGYDYIIVSNNHVLVKNNDGEIPSARDVVVADNNTISIDASEDILWTASAVTSDYGQCTLTNGSVYLYRSGYQESNLKLICEETSSANYVPWRFDGSYLSNGKTTQYYAYYDGGWKMLLVSEGGTTKPSVTTLLFTNRAPQNISFSAANAEYDLATSEWSVAIPTLSEAQTAVTYALSEDSNPAVATVDADGTVHPLSRGTVTIVATAAGNDQFQAASARYTVRVIDSSVVEMYYVLVTSEPASWDGKYLIVNTAADGTGTAMNGDVTASVTISGGKILSDETTDGYALTVTSAGEIHPNQTSSSQGLIAYDIRFNDGDWLYNYSSQYKQTSEDQGSRHNKCTFYYDNGGVRLMSAGYLTNLSGQTLSSVPGHYYLNYQSSGFTMTKDQTNARVQLYILDDGRQTQNLSFNPTTATYDLYAPTTFVKPTLSTAYGEVTYSSSDESIASVDASGNITGHKTGTVTITATAAGDTQHKPGSASYTLTVVNSDPNVKVYRKVTSTSDLEVGAEYLLVFEGIAGDTDGDGDPKVFKPVLNTEGTQFAKAQSSALAVTISSSTISSNQYVDCHFTLETGYYLKANNAGKYIYPGASGSSSVMLAEATASNALTITFDNGIAEIKNGSRYLVWSISSTGHYFSCNTAVSGTYSTGICLYKLDDGRQPQTLSFSPATATYDLYSPTSFVKPTLSTAYGDVTYSSSDATIAEVDNSGNITGKKVGTVTITATAAGDTQYKPGSATYTLTVENSDPSAPTNPVYTKVMSSADIVAGQKYLIVYESGASSKAFKPIVSGTTVTESAANAIDAPVSNNEITSTEDIDACQVFLMAATDGHYYIKTGDSYLYPGSSTLQAESSSTRPLAITISSGKLTIKRSQYNHYLVFNSYFRRAGSDSGNLALYTLDDGSNPGGGDDPQPPTPSTVTYTKVNSITSGATYLIVSPSDDGLFTGTTAGGVQSVTPENGVITSSSYSDYEFVITEEASGMYSIMYQGQYLYCNGNFSGTNATAIGYQGSVASLTLDNTQISDSYAFGFKMNANSADQFLYFKSSTLFKWGGSGKSTGVHLYKKADNP